MTFVAQRIPRYASLPYSARNTFVTGLTEPPVHQTLRPSQLDVFYGARSRRTGSV